MYGIRLVCLLDGFRTILGYFLFTEGGKQMLKNIPEILSPELLKILCEMGHGDMILFADANCPSQSMAKEAGACYLRADGVGIPALLRACLDLIPLDQYVDTPVWCMQKSMDRPDEVAEICKEYKDIIAKHDERKEGAVGYLYGPSFYELAKKAYCIIQTGEKALYANLVIRKGVI
jgi:L-fucose mutarotase